jgi:hypothetical protein
MGWNCTPPMPLVQKNHTTEGGHCDRLQAAMLLLDHYSVHGM